MVYDRNDINKGKNRFSEVECPELVEGQNAVYILQCNDGSYYVGYTINLRRRIQDHKNGSAAKWTARRLPFKLVYYEIYQDHVLASRREQQIKGWSRVKKEKLITGEWKQY